MMNMNKYIVLAASVALVSLSSCSKESEPEAEPLQPGYTRVTVKASHEYDTSTKTSVDLFNGFVCWSTGDMTQAVYNGGSAISDAVAEEGTTAKFTYSYPAGKTLAYAVYPSDIGATYDGSILKVTIPASQDGSFAGAAIEVAEFAETLSLKNLAGLLQLAVADDAVKTIRISSNDNTPVAGTAVVTFQDGLPVIGTLTGTSTSITLTVDGAGTYYAAILPCSLEAGIYVELLDENDVVVGEKISGNPLTVGRRQIKPLGTIGTGTINKFFFKPDGAGDGSSWKSAGGMTLMDAVLSGSSDATLFLAQGTYHMSAIDGIADRTPATSQNIRVSNHIFRMYGGYPASSTGTSLTGRDLSDLSVPTVISGDNTYRILVLNGGTVQLTADGITFSGSSRSSSDIGSALILANQKKAFFNKCVISDNVKAGTGAGGAIRITQGNVSFTDCEFTGNTATADGGVMAIAGGTVSLQDCRFDSNSAGGNGGVLYISGGTVDIKDSEFTNNTAKESGKRGSVIFSSGSSVVRLNGCYLASNQASAGGTIWSDSSDGKLFLNACAFYMNKTATYASAIGSRGICGVNNCAFQQNSNTSSTGASNFYTVNGTSVITNSSFRMGGNAAVSLWAAGGTTYLANSTLVNSNTSDDADKAVALKSSAPLISYGHSIASKFYEVTADTYSLQDAGDADLLNYSLFQTWHSTKHCIWWTKWNDNGPKPVGFDFATPVRVEDALDAFEVATSAGFKTWLQSLRINGYNALQTDILGYVRGAKFVWPGSYENTVHPLAPTDAGTLQKFTKTGTIIRGNVADPCLVYSHGDFYLTMTGSKRIAMIRDSDLDHLKAANHSVDDNIIYDSENDPNIEATLGSGATVDGTWSPEIHYFTEEDCPGNSGWYMVFALRRNVTTIKSVVLKASGTSRPTGPWRHPVTGEIGATQRFLNASGGTLDQWAIGVSYLRIPSGRYKGIYATWVDYVGRGQGYGNFYQRICIARFSKPWQIASEAAVINTPTQDWEKIGADDEKAMVVEGATAVYGDHGEIYITYCGSGYWSEYGQGQLTLKRENGDYADPLKRESWIKYENNPIFSSTPSGDLWGAGHVFLFKDDAGNRFITYHAYPMNGGVKGSSRNAYVEPYYIDYSETSATAPQGVIHFGANDNGVTGPVTSTSFNYYLKK